MSLMSPEVHRGGTLALTLLSLVYLRGWYRLRSSPPNVLPVWRLAAFAGGVLSLWVALESPLAALDHQLLTFHMVQHLLLMTVSAPLILLGAPGITLLHSLPRNFVRVVFGPLLRNAPVHAVGRVVTHPLLCWLASTFVVIGWHIPALFEIGMQSELSHEIEHASFFAAGLLFWWPVVQPWPSEPRWPRWGVPLYLFLAALPCDALSAFLTFCNRVVYSHYLLPAHRLFDVSPIADQECAGALMWVCATLAYLIPAAVVTIQMLSPPTPASQVEVV
jgi:putative membrane protein